MKRSISIKDLISIQNEPTSEDLSSPSRYQNQRFYSIRKCRNLHYMGLYCKEKWLKFKNWRKKRKNNFFYQMYLHLTLHLLLLSIFEPLFFFQYASKIEQEVFMNQVSSYFYNVNDNIQPTDFSYNISSTIPFPINEEIIENEIKKEILEYQKNNKKMTENEFQEIKKRADNGKSRREEKENYLKEEAGRFALWFGALFGFGAFLNIFVFRINWFKLFLEHIILIIGIGLYELWFFKNILLKYDPLSPAEIDLILAPCMYKILGEKITIFGEAPFKNNQTNCAYF